ncbi:hypothetical protein MASR1M74_26210 [Lentimicrobium sp.]
MKNITKILALMLLIVLTAGVQAQSYENQKLNLPGDNLNLYAVMQLFQESETLEGFERQLNAADARVNNLDLNGDNLIDYIKVTDYADGATHTIVLQVAINERESQDVAVFTVFRDKDDQVFIQLIGDEYLYGKDYIIEPIYAETPNPGYTGNSRTIHNQSRVVTRTTYITVRTWPVVRYIYMPTYVVYRSPWYWNHYPVYWRPWNPYYWDYYYGYHSHWLNHYYSHYRHCNHYYNNYYSRNYYRGHRSHSSLVRTYQDEGRYSRTYSRPDLRSRGSDEGKRVYASAMRNPGRSDGSRSGRDAQDINRHKAASGVTPSATRKSAPGNGRSVQDKKSSKSVTSLRQEAPVRMSKAGRTRSVQSTTPSNKKSVRSAAPRERTRVSTSNSAVKTPRAESPVRQSNRSAVRNSDRPSSKSGQSISRPSSRSSHPQRSGAVSSGHKRSGASGKSNGSGR